MVVLVCVHNWIPALESGTTGNIGPVQLSLAAGDPRRSLITDVNQPIFYSSWTGFQAAATATTAEHHTTHEVAAQGPRAPDGTEPVQLVVQDETRQREIADGKKATDSKIRDEPLACPTRGRQLARCAVYAGSA